jgi:Fe2+ or Zn2+ uptake regulation protein
MIVKDIELVKDIEFIIYNIVFDTTTRSITTDDVINKLQHNDISIDKKVVKKVLDKWTSKGLLFNNYFNYILC